jgi:lipopolysaccharide/colanic/teichoic acid biosynthesis glycosyltransferase
MYGKLEEKTFAGRIEQNLRPRSPEFLARAAACVLAFCGLFALSPLMFICAVLIRITSSGTIFFRQKRVGRGGAIFTLYKFRTMVASSGGLLITAENDCRVTPLGKILRRTKIDELPELFNVLRGDMALVGPRPEVVELVDFDNPLWREVLSARPGITDPVTIQFRNEENLLAGVEDKRKFYCEVIQPYKLNGYVQYLKSKNMINDLKIIVQTFKVILLPHTAPPIKIEGINSGEKRVFNAALSEQSSEL